MELGQTALVVHRHKDKQHCRTMKNASVPISQIMGRSTDMMLSTTTYGTLYTLHTPTLV